MYERLAVDRMAVEKNGPQEARIWTVFGHKLNYSRLSVCARSEMQG